MSKINTKEETKGNKVRKAKTVENVKYEPILKTQGLISRKLEFEKWTKIPHRG